MEPRFTPETNTTIVAALLHYGLTCYDGRLCIEALREMGMEASADALRLALSNRIYSAPGVRDWQAEERRTSEG